MLSYLFVKTFQIDYYLLDLMSFRTCMTFFLCGAPKKMPAFCPKNGIQWGAMGCCWDIKTSTFVFHLCNEGE